MTAAPQTIGVLFVCSGNICRSPTAEGVFRAIADSAGIGDRLDIDSAGIGGWFVGEAPDARAQEAALARGIDIGGQRARQVCAADFGRFDYLVGMDRSHQRALLDLAPDGAAGRVHLFMDFAPQAQTRDVPDPYHGALGGFDHVYGLIEAGAAGLLREIRDRLRDGG
jgi:protein-tyrosine phosphatase